jgi:hypothetical protein
MAFIELLDAKQKPVDLTPATRALSRQLLELREWPSSELGWEAFLAEMLGSRERLDAFMAVRRTVAAWDAEDPAPEN